MKEFNNFSIGEHIWFNQTWVGLSGGTILSFNSIIGPNKEPTSTFVEIHLDNGGITVASLESIRHTKEELLKEDAILVANYKAEIPDIETLVHFMFNNTISTGSNEYTNWEARQAVKERAKELLDIDL